MANNVNEKDLMAVLKRGGLSEAVKMTQQNPGLAVIASKLVKSNTPITVDRQNGPQTSLGMHQMKSMSDIIRQRITDNENIFEIFPDIERAKLILISSIMAPKDMQSHQVNYKINLPTVSPELLAKVGDILSDELETYYAFSDGTEERLTEAMFVSGAHVTCVLPESSVDDIINGKMKPSTESVTTSLGEIVDSQGIPKSLGILGPADVKQKSGKTTALENFRQNIQSYDGRVTLESGAKQIDTLISIHDNFQFLKLPEFNKRLTEQSMEAIITNSFGRRAKRKTSNESLYDAMFKPANSQGAAMYLNVDIENTTRKSAGRPLHMRVPTESVIPIHFPGDPSNHIGYFIMVDVDGYFISRTSRNDPMFNNSANVMDYTNGNTNGGLTNSLLTKARSNLQRSDNADIGLDDQARIFGSIIEQNILSRLKNGLIGGNVEISGSEEIYQTMLARSLANKFTRLVFLPANLVVYNALKYYQNGVGKSYLDNLKIITGLRAILLFAKVTGAAKNAIAVTKVNMTLDPNDPDPSKTIATSQNEVLKLRQQYIPLGINTASDLVDWVTRAGFEWSFEGHPALPQTKFDFQSGRIQHDLPDDELEENLRKQSYMYLGLPPEIVDNGFQADFATSIINDNILLARIVSQIQKVANRHLTKEGQLLARYDTIIYDRVMDVLNENAELVKQSLTEEEVQFYTNDSVTFLDTFYERLVDAFKIELPKPEVGGLNNLKESFTAFEEALDGVLKYCVSTDSLPEALIGQFNGNIDAITAVIKAYKVREWMASNGYFDDLLNLSIRDCGSDSNGIDFIANIVQHTQGTVTNSLKIFEELKAFRFAADKDFENLNVDPDAASPDLSNSDSGSNDDTSNDDTGGSDDTAGEGDAAGGDDFGDDFSMS